MFRLLIILADLFTKDFLFDPGVFLPPSKWFKPSINIERSGFEFFYIFILLGLSLSER